MTPLQHAREKKGLSQHQLAKQARVQQAKISLVESGKARASLDFAERIVAVLGPAITELEICYPERYEGIDVIAGLEWFNDAVKPVEDRLHPTEKSRAASTKKHLQKPELQGVS